MHNVIKRAASRRVVITQHRSGFGGQCRLASARMTLPELRAWQHAEPWVTPELVAQWHREACEDRTHIRREILKMSRRTHEEVRGRRIGPTSQMVRDFFRKGAFNPAHPHSSTYVDVGTETVSQESAPGDAVQMPEASNPKLWHVSAEGEWVSVMYTGYAPVDVMVDGRLRSTEFRHLARECDREACIGIRAAYTG